MEMGKIDTRTASAGSEDKASSRRVPPASTGMGSRLPIEWMDSTSWRLPSGKALAEFALQAGFLAPLMLNKPRWSGKKPVKKSK
jgi:hypothetical protein